MGFDSQRAVDVSPTPTQRPEVYLEVGVLPPELAPLRVVAADLAARADFDLDTVSDLRMAVDEACSTLAGLARPDARLRCVLQVDPDQITVTARVPVRPCSTISQDTFGWRVLATLADKVEVLTEDGSGGADDSTLGIRMHVRRVTAP